MQEKGPMIAQGRTGEIFAYGEGQILKLYLPGVSLDAVEHEYTVGRLVHQHGIPTPQPMARVDSDGRYGIVYERIEGKTMLHAMAAQPHRVVPMAKKLAELHAMVHQIRATGLPSRQAMVRRDIGQVHSLTEERRAAVLRQLDSLAAGDCLCHGDFHPDNILIKGDQALVIDWMTGAVGSPAGDVARTCIILSTATPPPGAPRAVAEGLSQLQTIFYREYLKRYLELSSLSLAEIEQWVLPIAAARLAEGLPDMEQQQLLAMIEAKLAGEMVLVVP